MKLKLNHNILIALFFFSVTCKAQLLPEEPIRFHKDYTEKGLIFGTLTFPSVDMKFDMYFIQITYKSLDKKLFRRNSSKIKLTPTMFVSKHNGELEGGKTYLFALEKPPGDYIISWIRLSTLKLMQYNSNDTDITGFSIPFTVNKGEITYIGEININENDINGKEAITLKDEFERDKNAMKNLYKLVNWDSAVKSKLELNRNNGTEQQN